MSSSSSTSSAKQPQAKQVLAIVEKIGLKIGVVNGGKSLENMLDTHLPQLLTLLAFPDNSVRTKVIEVLSNTVNKRVKLETSIKLPFGKILELFQKELSNSFIKNFAVMYLDMGFPQLSSSEINEYLPSFFQALPLLASNVSGSDISLSNRQHQSMFLRFILESLGHISYPEKEEDALEKFQDIRNNESGALDIFLDFATDFMMFKPSQKSQGTLQSVIPNGLNMMKIKRILGSKENMDAQEVQTKKMQLIDFITKSTCFSENQQFLILLIGMSQQESTDQLGSRCDVLLKKLNPDFEESALVDKLYALYLGDSSNGISQASLPLKYKILTYLCKSTQAANHFPETHLVLMDSLFNEYASMKLRGFGMQFFMWIIQEGITIEPKYASEVFSSILSNVNRLSSSGSNTTALSLNDITILKENMYTALGSFTRKFPNFVLDRFDLVERFFDALAFEDLNVRVAVLQGLSHLTHAFKVLFMNKPENEIADLKKQFENLFYEWIVERNTGLTDLLRGGTSQYQKMTPSARTAVTSAVLRCANNLFPFDHVISRFLCLFCTAGGFGSTTSSTDNQSHQIREECGKGTDIEKFTKFRQLDHWILQKKSNEENNKNTDMDVDTNSDSTEESNSLPMFKTVHFTYPSFKSMVTFIYDFMAKFDVSITKSTSMPALNKIVTPSAHSAMINFCFDCLKEETKQQNISMLQLIQNMSTQSNNMNDENEKDDFEKFLYIIEKSFDDKILLQSGSTSNATDLLREATDTLLKLLLSLKDRKEFIEHISRRFSFLLEDRGPFLFDIMIGNYDEIAREHFSKFIALLFIFVRQDPNKTQQCEKLTVLWRDFIQRQLTSFSLSDHRGEANALGSILTVANVISLNYCLSYNDHNEPYLIDSFQLILDIITTIPLSNVREPLHQACYYALGEMGNSGALQHYLLKFINQQTATTLGETTPSPTATSTSEDPKIKSMNELTSILVKRIEKYASLARQKNASISNEKILEKLITAVGRLTIGTLPQNDPNVTSHLEAFISQLFELNNVKSASTNTGTGGSSSSSSSSTTTSSSATPQVSIDENISFTVGEALSLMSGGLKYCTLSHSDSYYEIYKMKQQFTSEQEENEHYDSRMRYVLTRLVRECVLNPKKIVRQASSIWLLSVTRYSGVNNEFFRKYIKEVQKAFSLLVTENNEVTSEVAGRGLGYVYEMADPSDRKALVSSLMTFLIGNKKPQNTVQDTEELVLFPAGEEHQKGGKNAPTLSTYKELVDAATDIGRPEMIYQLLAVSNHNAIWNAKKAYAFSISSILSSVTGDSLSNEEFEKAMPQLVPKLYRFLFDPNPAISSSMKEMWKSLFGQNETDKTKQNMITSKYLPRIMREILNGLNQELWRIREACCYAVCDLFGGGSAKTFEEMAPYIKECFQKVWRVTDDIKDTCRKAANSALQRLSAFAIKSCNPTYTSKRENVSRALSIVIPLLLHEGLLFPFKDVVYVSLSTLKEVVHVSVQYIKPHIYDIISTILQQMSVLEPAEFNYLQMNAERYGISVEQLESLRLSAMSRSGPLSEIIMDCERHIDESVLQQLVPSLLEILQLGVGLQTRAHCAKFISHLGKFQGRFLKDYVNEIDAAIMSAILQSESIAERKELATALSQVVKNGKASEGKRVLQEILALYTQEEGVMSQSHENEMSRSSADELRLISAMILEQISKNCPILLKKFYDIALPIMFIARHDKKLHIKVVVDKCIALLDHPTWELKRQGGSALAEVSSSLGVLLNEKQGERERMINALLNSIVGRVWEGKTVLLKALGSICETFVSKEDQSLSTSNQQEMKILELLLKECKKKDLDYKCEALKAFHSAVKTLHFTTHFISQEFYEQAKTTFLEEMQNIEKEEEEEIRSENSNEKRTERVNNDKTYHEEKLKRDLKSNKREACLVQIIHILSYLVPSSKTNVSNEERKKALEWIFHQFLAPRLTLYLTPPMNNALLSALLQYVKLRKRLSQELPFIDLEEQQKILQLLVFNIDPNNRQVNVRPVAFNTLKEVYSQMIWDDSHSSLKSMLKTQLEEISKRIMEPLLHDQVTNFSKQLQ
ncbi:hypothetical protein C9374_002580 [Naegleria lovaniensis]|uniref:Uncharacterized protein n=1 Tax=Naegleria lovaniensis TaxID=51637 RepID=A0AA88GUT8_NAELO|nr:uncharacterized protein C9374_002580 [Naegleria lovaniensis]KAG2386134.1 hypothetical protein C9374_002580 [Naegleria lovaniensis]